MSLFVKDAVQRVEEFLKNYDGDQPAEIIADLLHYCREQGIDFEDQVRIAREIVDIELDPQSAVNRHGSFCNNVA